MTVDWEKFLGTNVLVNRRVDQVLMCGKQDGAIWASTPDFKLRMYSIRVQDDRGGEEETLVNEAVLVSKLVQTFLEPAEGIRINGVKYTVVDSFANGIAQDGLATIYLKRSHGGGCICVTKKAVIMASFDEGKGQTASHCNLTIERAGRSLLALGY